MDQEKKVTADWLKMIADIERAGYPNNAIATFVGVGLHTVIGWMNGRPPRVNDAELLIDLWCQVTGAERGQIPSLTRADTGTSSP